MQASEEKATEQNGATGGSDFNSGRYGQEERTGIDLRRDDRMPLLFRILDQYAGKKILDVGCAEGSLSHVFKEKGLYTIAVDASVTAIERVRPRYDEAYLLDSSTQTFPIPDASVDLIWAGEIIEHVFNTEFFADELFRVLKPGGRMVMTTPNLACWINRIVLPMGLQPFFTEVGIRPSNSGNFLRQVGLPAGHIRVFTVSSLKHLLRGCGWTVESVHGAAVMERRSIKWFDRLISHAFPSMASDMVFVCRK